MEASVKWAFEDETTFSDIVHINNHFNYLFRTDKAQKWTNARTKGDVAIHCQNGTRKVEVFGDDQKVRKDRELDALRRFKLMNDTKGISRRLRMASAVCMDGGATELTKGLFDSINSLLKDIERIKGVELFLCVVHVDQDRPVHFHLVFKNSSGKDVARHLEGGRE